MSGRRAAVAALLAALVLSGAAAPGRKPVRKGAAADSKLSDAKRSLEEKRRNAEKVKPVIQEKKRQEKSVLVELDRLDRKLGNLQDELRRYRDEIAMTEAQLEALRRQSRLTSDELKRSAERLRRSLVLWQTGGGLEDSPWSPGGPVPGDVALRCGAGEADRLMAGRLTRLDIQSRSAKQADRLAELRRLRRGLAAKEREAAAARRDRNAFLNRVRAEKARNERLLGEYERSGRELERLVGRLAEEARRARTAAPVPSTARVGQLLWPVAGPVLRRFGRQKHEAFNATVFSTGIEIKAAEGTPVRAAEAGRVIYLDWLTGYGRVMIVDHGSGFCTLYGHLDEARAGVGSRVNRGTTIATVGDTGSLGAPSLYFEVRHHGQPADPARYLGKAGR